MELPTVTVADLPLDAVLLDVREPDEWAAGHIEGAVHVPMHSVPGRLAEIAADKVVVVVCRVGARSAQVTAFLAQHGFDAWNLAGGMYAWADSGAAMTSDTGQPPTVL